MFCLPPFIYNMISIFSGHCISLLPSSKFLSQHKIIDVIHTFSLLCNNYLLSQINSQKHSMGILKVTEKFLCTCGMRILDRVVVALDERVWTRGFRPGGGRSGIPRNFVRGGSTNSVDDRGHRQRGYVGSSPLVRSSGGSCNLVQEISFHIVKSS